MKTKLRIAREARGLSRPELSRRTHAGDGLSLSGSLIAAAERGYHPSEPYARALADALGIEREGMFDVIEGGS